MKQHTDTGEQTDRELAEIQKERKNWSNTGGNETIWQEYAEIGFTYKAQVKHISNQLKLEQRQEVKLKNGENKTFKIKQEVKDHTPPTVIMGSKSKCKNELYFQVDVILYCLETFNKQRLLTTTRVVMQQHRKESDF